MPLIRLLVVAALLAASAVVPSVALPLSATVTVSGSGPAWTEVTFRTPFRPLLATHDDPPPSITTRGTYAGVWLEPVADPRRARGFVMAPSIDRDEKGRDHSMRLGLDGSLLPAGRYRVHLLAQAKSEVRFAVAGLTAPLRIRPTRPALVRGQVKQLGLVSGATAGRATLSVVVGRKTVTYAVGWAESAAQGHFVSVCFEDPATPPCPAGGNPNAGGPSGGTHGGIEVFVPPGGLKAGEHDIQYVLAGSAVKALVAFALTFDVR